MRNNTHIFCILFITSVLFKSAFVRADNNPWAEPIWKSPPLPENPDAEFNSYDPYGLAVGAKIRTDCSIRYVWHLNKKLYCFNSLTSKAFFMDNPKLYIRNAEAFLITEEGKAGEP